MFVSSHLHQHGMALDLYQSGVSLEFCFLSNELPVVLLTLLLFSPPFPHSTLGPTQAPASLWRPGLEEKALWDSVDLDPGPATCPLCNLD